MKKTKKTKTNRPLGRRIKEVKEIQVAGESAVVVPLEVWESILEELDEYHDLQCYDQACELPDEETIEHDELCRVLGRCPLCYLRSQAGISNKELAKKSGLAEEFLCKIESGEKSLSKSAAQKIAKALGIPMEKILIPPE